MEIRISLCSYTDEELQYFSDQIAYEVARRVEARRRDNFDTAKDALAYLTAVATGDDWPDITRLHNAKHRLVQEYGERRKEQIEALAEYAHCCESAYQKVKDLTSEDKAHASDEFLDAEAEYNIKFDSYTGMLTALSSL